MENVMDLEDTFGLTEATMKVIGKKTKLMDKASLCTWTEMFMMVNGVMIWLMEKECIYIVVLNQNAYHDRRCKI